MYFGAQFYKILTEGPLRTFWKIFLQLILSMSRKGFHISSGRWSKTQNVDQNRIYPSPGLTAIPFFKGC